MSGGACPERDAAALENDAAESGNGAAESGNDAVGWGSGVAGWGSGVVEQVSASDEVQENDVELNIKEKKVTQMFNKCLFSPL